MYRDGEWAATKKGLVIKGKLFPLENIPDNDYAADASYASDAYEATHFTSSTLMKLTLQSFCLKLHSHLFLA